ncbi:copper amine oxidase N-terminal domain-containing protein [Paenibacillus motobuensis]|uniref:Copper amine oxidase-like N-terminal domain-containing protein n=1 Tax=Paenibacillus motobuensis TaxID=295324 RepID=A0ABN0Y870_9BACL
MKIKKKVFVASLVACGLLSSAITVGAATGIQKIQAALNHNITFELDGSSWTPRDPDGKKLSALVYDGSTYVPLRAVSEALGAEVNWNGGAQKIIINSNGGNEGIPYKDGQNNGSSSSGSSTSSNSGSASTGSNSSSSSSSTSSSSMGSGVFTYKKDFNENTAKDELAKESIKVIKLYADALKSGNMSELNAYVDAHVAEKDYAKSYALGKQYSKDNLKQKVDGTRDANDKSTLNDYSSALKNLTVSSIKNPDINKYSNSATFSYYFSPEGFNYSGMVSISFVFATLDDGTYILSAVSVN